MQLLSHVAQLGLSAPLASPRRTALVLLLTDVLTVVASLLLAVWLRYLWDRSLLWEVYLDLWPALFLFPIAYGLAGLYGVGIAPPEELRRLSYATSLVFVVLGGATFMYKAGADYSRGAFVFAWVFMMLFAPLARALVREWWVRKPWWGVPVVVLGAGQTGRGVIRALNKQPGLGLKPVGLLDDDPAKQGEDIEGVRVLGGLDRAGELARQGVKYAIVAMPGVPRNQLLELLERHGTVFPHLLLVPDLFGLSSLWVSARDLGGVLGLEVRQRLLQPGPQWIKRAMDIAFCLLLAPFLFVSVGILGLLVRLDSAGPIFYGHKRLGFQGREFLAWKFRSMVPDADRKLEEYLRQHPELMQEWIRDQKLKNDPRITRVGSFLRKTSLDELPQLWNVLRGEMSLVGPRPIVEEEVRRYGPLFALYTKVRPGLTGLWQVSGRNDTTYAERVAMDAYYVRNWSPWLDLYILARTVWVVLYAKGAY